MATPLDWLAAAERYFAATARGEQPNILDEVQVARLGEYVGARRPLWEYSPRTRRRYLAAARRGETRPYAREYQRRKQSTAARWGGATPAQVTRIRQLARKNEAALRRDPQNSDVSLDDDFLRQAAEVYGPQYLLTVLKEQRDSIRAWSAAEDKSQGRHHVGNRRWFGREKRETRLLRMRQRGVLANSDPLYYYHGHV